MDMRQATVEIKYDNLHSISCCH